MSEKTVPPLCSEEAEQALLGACLLDPQCAAPLIEKIPTDHFYLARHRVIWDALGACLVTHHTFDYPLLLAQLEHAGRLEHAGGAAYLAHLFTAAASFLNAGAYAETVQQYAARRATLNLATTVAQLAYQQGLTTADLFAKLGQQLTSAQQQFRTGHKAESLPAVVAQVRAELEALRAGGVAPGIPTGIPDLDRLTGGLFPGDVVLVAARPGVGKTALLVSVARHLLATGHPVLFFSLEMSNTQVVRRLLAGEAQVDGAHLRTGQLSAAEWERVGPALDRLAQLPLTLDETPDASLAHLRATAQAQALTTDLQLICVDYIQLVSAGRPMASTFEEVTQVSRQLKALARDLNVPILAAAQLNRGSEQRTDKRPTLADLRASGQLEQDADMVWLLHRPGLYAAAESQDLTELEVAKHRHGPTGTINILFQSRWQRFVGAAAPAEVAHG